MRVLVDTNIFLDIFAKRKGLYETSREFFIKSHVLTDEIYVCASTFKDLAYFLKKDLRDDNLVNNYLMSLYGQIKKVISITADDAINAIYEDGDYEDNVLISAANRVLCDAIITRNIKDFENKGINCFTPEEYLKYRE